MSLTSRTILIVDDSPEDRALYRRYLLRDQEYSYTILEASSGRQGLDLWQQRQPDILLLDYRLPDLDGLEFLTQLQASLQQPAPVVIVTGQGNEAIAVQAMKAGAQDYLIKGQITPERLYRVVNGAFQALQLQTQLQQLIERERLVAQITRKIHQTLDLQLVLQTAVTEVQQFLQTDRVLMFRVQSDGWGKVVAEIVRPEWTSLLSTSLYDPCFNQNYIESFRQGLVTIKPDIYDGSIDPCHVELLANLQVRANLVVPIVSGGRLWGMLIAHHCAAPRPWKPLEVDLLKEVAIQVGIAHQQAELYQQAQDELAERRQAEVSLRDSQHQFQSILDNSPAVIYVYDPNDRYLLVNRKFAERLSTSPESLIGKSVYDVWSTSTADALAANNQEVWHSNQVVQTEEEIPESDGLHTYITLRFPLCDTTGTPYAVCGISTDITQKKQLEQMSYRSQRLESLGTLANGIAHDLNNVFTPMILATSLLQQRQQPNPDAQSLRMLQLVEKSAKRGADMVKQILTFTRGTSGTLTPVKFASILQEVAKVAQQTFPKAIEICETLPSQSFGLVYADATQLHQVLLNLCINARDAMPDGGVLTLSLENFVVDKHFAQMNPDAQTGNYVLVTVEDTGTGIAPEHLEHIFEPFFTTKELGQGTGLGLSTVLGIVKNHSGFLQVTSELGKYTQFKVYLPALAGSAAQPATEEGLFRGNGEWILIVDDEATVLETIAASLESYDYSPLVASDGNEAIALYGKHRQKIKGVLLDMMMPGMDGATTIRTLKTMNPQVRIIATSGLEANSQTAILAGAKKFLPKPYCLLDLLRALHELLTSDPSST